MKKLVGYVVAIVGVVVMVFGFGLIPFEIEFLDGIAGNIISGVGIVLIIAGAIISFKGGSRTQKEEEVPIYEGDKIVGYRKN